MGTARRYRFGLLPALTALTALGTVAWVLGSPGTAAAAGRQAAERPDETVLPFLTGFSPQRGPVGTTVTIRGTGFGAEDVVSFAGTMTAPEQVSADGSRLTAAVPTGAGTGRLMVMVPSGVTAVNQSPFTVTEGVVAEPTSASPGGGFAFSGSGFARSTILPLTVDGSRVGTATTSANGSFSFTYTVPVTEPLGTYVFRAGHSHVPFAVIAPTPAVPVTAAATTAPATDFVGAACTADSLTDSVRDLSYTSPVKMVVGQASTVTAFLALHKPGPGRHPGLKTKPITTTCNVLATLSPEPPSNAFTIDKEDSPQQSFRFNSTLTWNWGVTPNVPGPGTLGLVVSSAGSGSADPVGTYVEHITVSAAPVTLGHRIWAVMSSAFFLAVISLVIGGSGVGALFRRRKRSGGDSDGPGDPRDDVPPGPPAEPPAEPIPAPLADIIPGD